MEFKEQGVAKVLPVKCPALQEEPILLSLEMMIKVVKNILHCQTLKRSATWPSCLYWPSKGVESASRFSLLMWVKLYLKMVALFFFEEDVNVAKMLVVD